MDPVSISIVGTGTGDGGGARLTSGTIAETPGHQPNLVLKVVNPLIAIGVRAGHVFLITFFGALGTGAVGATPADWTWKTAALIAGGAAFVETGKNLITIFSGLEREFPLGTGSI